MISLSLILPVDRNAVLACLTRPTMTLDNRRRVGVVGAADGGVAVAGAAICLQSAQLLQHWPPLLPQLL